MQAIVSKRKNEYREWVVKAYDADGNRLPRSDYFTNDHDDAIATAKAMIESAK